ncbi:Outer membrane protein assembly factor BamB [Durusdinium trenchii]|uniref:Outer membrane protein assembly factor BamB n=1 Tax=Durusdinium trenchii TaxID=1381693 RepID=A0ABP0K2I6_9DINO
MPRSAATIAGLIALFTCSAVLALEPASTPTFPATDWPWWRGPARNGVAAVQEVPLNWSETENVLWKAPVPGRGHGSPTVVGDRIYLATADEEREVQSVLCYDRGTGREIWKTDVHVGHLTKKGNKKSTQASASVACDGERLFINFLNNDAVFTTALDLDGQQLWQTRITDYVVHQGYGSSPAIYGPLVLVTADNKGGGAIAGLDRATGQIVWRHDRPATPNYPSPIIHDVAGRTQLLLTGCDLVSSFDPLSGNLLWEIEGATTECVTSTVVCGDLMFTSGGYPKNHIAAVRADGSGDIAWEIGTRNYVPSLLVYDGYLYASTDAGVAMCWRCNDGAEMWKGRLGGTFTSSPVLVGDKILATNEAGESFWFAATPEEFKLIGKNRLGDQAFATPTICGNRIYHRAAEVEEGVRKEYLYCIGKRAPR